MSLFGPGGSGIHSEAGSTGMGRVSRGQGSQGTAKVFLPDPEWPRQGLSPQGHTVGDQQVTSSLVAWPGLGAGAEGC